MRRQETRLDERCQAHIPPMMGSTKKKLVSTTNAMLDPPEPVKRGGYNYKKTSRRISFAMVLED